MEQGETIFCDKKKMGVEWTKYQYNEKYRHWGDRMYNRFEKYKPMWSKILDRIDKNEDIADFGCGAGLFARYAITEGYSYSYGVDFSEEAIKKAQNMNPEHPNKFITGDLYEPWVYKWGSYNVALFLDILEHLNKDKNCLSFIEQNTKVILALPTFWSPDHVRVFKNSTDIEERYNSIIDFTEIFMPVNIWIAVGKRK